MTEHRVLTADRITDVLTHHGEGPVWPGDGRLHLVDMLAGAIVRVDPRSGEHDRVGVGSTVAAALRPRTGGGFVVARERDFALIEPNGTIRDLPEVWPDPAIRFNDGGCDPDGRFYCGTMAYGAAPGKGRLYRLDQDARVTTVLTDVTISNGFAFSPDGDTAYYVDTPTGRVDAFTYTDGELTDRRPCVADAGHPDGMCVDAAGGLWVAQFGGGAVLHFAPSGQLLTRVEVGARQVTACTFGGDDLATLYITTSRENLSADDDPAAGSVFAVRPDVQGLPVLPFSG